MPDNDPDDNDTPALDPYADNIERFKPWTWLGGIWTDEDTRGQQLVGPLPGVGLLGSRGAHR